MTRVRRVAGMLLLASALLTAPAFAAFAAFDVSPGSLTIQAGDTATGTLSSLPIASDGQPGCLETTGTLPNYLSVTFSQPCGGQAGWSSSMTVRTIPATPAGSYTITFQVCPTPGCSMGPDIRNAQPIQTRSWAVVVTGSPVPVDSGPSTPAPLATTPAPVVQTPAAAPTPSRSSLRTVPATSTPTPTPSQSPAHTALSGQSPATVAVGVAPGLVLNHPALRAGQTLQVSGTGCTPGVPTTVSVPGSVTTTATSGPDGTFTVSLHLPSSFRAGRYTVTAECGVALSTLVDVQRPRSLGTVLLLGSGVLALLVTGLVIGGLARSRR